MKKRIYWLVILAFLLPLNSASSDEVSIYGLTVTLSEGILTQNSAGRIEAFIDKLHHEFKYNTALEVAQFYQQYAGEDTTFRATMFTAKCLYLTRQGEEAYRLLEKTMEGFTEGDDQSRDYFSQTVLEMVVSPTYEQRQEQILKTSLSQDTTTEGEWETVETYDLQWAVNILYLIKDIDAGDFKEGKDSLISVIDQPRTVSISYTNQSSPQINVERANDEALAGLIYWGKDTIPGFLVKVLENDFNLSGFGLCIGRPISFLEMASFFKNKVTYHQPRIIKTLRYDESEFSVYRSYAMCEASIVLSLADIFTHFNAKPHSFYPFVPKAPKLEKDEVVADEVIETEDQK